MQSHGARKLPSTHIYIYTYYLIWYVLKSLLKRKKVFCPCLPVVAHHVQSLTILSFRTGDGWAKKEERWGRCLGSVETFVEGFSRCETIGHTFFAVGWIFQIGYNEMHTFNRKGNVKEWVFMFHISKFVDELATSKRDGSAYTLHHIA